MLKTLLFLTTLVGIPAAGSAQTISADAMPAAACVAAITAVERESRTPQQLLSSIAMVESGRIDPVSTRTVPWPWTINVEGTGYFFPTKQEAVDAVRRLTALRVRSIDVGCMQINLMYHPNAFRTLEDAFDPTLNVKYGATLLESLHRQFGGWPLAIAAYHSQTPGIGAGYWNRVLVVWPQASRFTDGKAMAVATSTASPALPANAGPALVRQLAEATEDHRRNMDHVGSVSQLHVPGAGRPRAASIPSGPRSQLAQLR